MVVPFFESERTIARCIDSLQAQRDVEGRTEILFVDNGSTDASAAIVARAPGIELLTQSKPGAYAARNTGIRTARAPVIAFTDPDCVVEPGWLRSILEGMREPENAILLGHCGYPPDSSPVLRLLGAYENAKIEYVLDRCPSPHHFAYANNMAVRASVFQELGLFEEWPRAADSELVHRLARQRPDLRVSYRPTMKVTHLEFVRSRKRLGRLRLYRQTNSRIETFRELGLLRRLGVLLHMLRVV